uniref:Uncharacterized protein n=1 Tax=Myoviridae sp. ctj994 TaxID=2825160 RepID=A0A8S5NZ42_9CAUD|nr:MAG TPA: hypothetical protein [Myoviridae sp. ctj994]
MRRPFSTSFLSLDIQLSTVKFLLHRDNLRAGATSGGFCSRKYLFNFYSHLKTAMRILSL